MLATMRHTPTQQPHQFANAATSPSHSQPVSRTGSTSSSRSLTRESKLRASAQKHRPSSSAVAMASSSSASSSSSPMRQRSKSSRQPEVVGSSTPGLISLSRPMETATKAHSGKSSRKALSKGYHEAHGTAKAAALSGDDKTDEKRKSHITSVGEGQLLSTSAPSAPPRERSSASEKSLTWQQQLMSETTTAKGKGSSKKGARAKTADASALVDKNKSDPTWQQALFASSSKGKRGPKFDVFADTRDAETFGQAGSAELRRSGSLGNEVNRASVMKKAAAAVGSSTSRGSGSASSAGKSAKGDSLSISDSMGDISVDDVFHNRRSSSTVGVPLASNLNGQRSPLPPQPSTPVKRPQGHPSSSPALMPSTSAHHLLAPNAAEAAYAGPDFHNSPSAASLPAPKFMSSRASKAMQTTGNCARLSNASLSSSVSSEGSDRAQAVPISASSSFRSARGSPAPVALQGGSSPVRLVESSSSPHVAPVVTSAITPATTQNDKMTTIENLLARMMG